MEDRRIFVSKMLAGEIVGLEEIGDGIWPTLLRHGITARFDEREMKFYG